MLNVSSAFKQLLYEGKRNYLSYADITLSDGTKLSLDNSDIWDSGMEISDSVSSDNSFDVGAAIVNSSKIVINNIYDDYSDYDFSNAEVIMYVGMKLPDGTIERIRKGTFHVDEAKYNGAIITLNCLDNISKFDSPYSESTLKYPATLGQIVRDACLKCGVTLQTYNFPHDDYVVKERPDDEATTFGEVIQWAAQIACCFCRCDVYGRLELKWYDQEAFENRYFLSGGTFKNIPPTNETVSGGTFNPWTDGETINSGEFSELDGLHHIYSLSSISTSTDDVVITGVSVSVRENDDDSEQEIVISETGTSGYVISFENNELINVGDGPTIAGWIGERLIGFRFRKASISHLSDPTIEAGDVAILTDTKGRSYNIIISSTKFNSNGSHQNTESSALDPIRNSAARFSEATKNYIDYRKEIKREKTAREQAIENLTNRINNSSGVFTTIVTQPDKSNIYYLHNKPSLDDSDIIWQMTAEAWGVSTDGGKTYNAGMTVDGDTIVRILTATGVNADWINTGAIQVTDDDGNIIFSVDMDTKQIVISGDFVQIGGKSASAAINDALQESNEALEEAKKARSLNIILGNEYQGIYADSDGNIGNFPTVQTAVQVLYGSTDVSVDCTYSIAKSSGITGSWNGGSRTYTVTGLSTDAGWVDITANYLNLFTATKRFNIEKIKGGENGQDGLPGRTYFIEPSQTVLKQDIDYNISPGYIDFNAYYRDGQSAQRIAYFGRFKIEEEDSNGTWTNIYTSTADESSVRHILYDLLVDSDGSFVGDSSGYALGGWRDISNIRVTLYDSGGTSTIIDQQTVPVVKDGEPGKDGKDGTELTPEDVFNILTNYGEVKGIYKIGNQLYISFTYARGGELVLGGSNNGNGLLKILDTSGNQVGYIDNTGVHFNQGTFSGNLSAAKGTFSGTLYIGNWNGQGEEGEIRVYDAEGKLVGRWGPDSFWMTGQQNFQVSQYGILYTYEARIQNAILMSIKPSNSSISEIDSDYVRAIDVRNSVVGSNRGYSLLFGASEYGDPQKCILVNVGDPDLLQFNITSDTTTAYGDFNVTGEKNRIVNTENYGYRKLSSYEMTSPMFGDIGTAETDENGECIIYIDDIFYETINSGIEYHVFLQKEGEGDVWVDSKQQTYFSVRGTSNLKFSWEIKVKQREYEYNRLESDIQRDRAIGVENLLPTNITNKLEELLYETN